MVRTVHGGLLNLRRIIFFADHVPPETDRDEIPCGSDDLVGSTGVGDHLVRGSGNRPWRLPPPARTAIPDRGIRDLLLSKRLR